MGTTFHIVGRRGPGRDGSGSGPAQGPDQQRHDDGGRDHVPGGGPEAGLRLLDELDDDRRMAGSHRLSAVRAHLHELAGDRAAARDQYLAAARRTTSRPERRYLERRAAALGEPGGTPTDG